MLPSVQSLGWQPSLPLTPLPAADEGDKNPLGWGSGVHTTSSQPSPAPSMRMLGQIAPGGTLPCSLHLWRDPALLPLFPGGDPPRAPQCNRGPQLSAHQASAELQSPVVLRFSGESRPACSAGRKCPCER